MEWVDIQFRNYPPSKSIDLVSVYLTCADQDSRPYRPTTRLFELYHGLIPDNGYSRRTIQVSSSISNPT